MLSKQHETELNPEGSALSGGCADNIPQTLEPAELHPRAPGSLAPLRHGVEPDDSSADRHFDDGWGR
jgi:hypothetical protein